MLDNVLPEWVPLLLLFTTILLFFIVYAVSDNEGWVIKTITGTLLIASLSATIYYTGKPESQRIHIATEHIEDTYGVTVERKLAIAEVFNNNVVPVTLDIDNRIYRDTYYLVYNNIDDTLDIVIRDQNENIPTPEELKERTSLNNHQGP